MRRFAPTVAAPVLEPARGLALVPDVSVVIPVLDEADALLPLLDEVHAALQGRETFEVVVVDDGSRDATPVRLAEGRRRHPWLRVARHDRSSGQSAAIRTGVRLARGAIVVTLDGDGQNDPADVPALLAAYRDAAPGGMGLVAGQRTLRQDGRAKRWASRAANAVRGRILGDGVADTGCGLKVFSRSTFLDLPYFDHMHRFLPALVAREGRPVRLVPVRHRPRTTGRSKYGVWDRLLVGITDLFGVLWLTRRYRPPAVSVED